MKKLVLIALLLTLPTFVQAQARHMRRERVHNDATRLGALLHDVQRNIVYNDGTWRTVGNESLVLANRIFNQTMGNRAAHAAARDLRMHVREMRNAANHGDAAGARAHASEALPFDYTVIDWAGARG